MHCCRWPARLSASILAVCVASLILSCSSRPKDRCGRDETQAFTGLQLHTNAFLDEVELASSTESSALARILVLMMTTKEAPANLSVPACLREDQAALVQFMADSIDFFGAVQANAGNAERASKMANVQRSYERLSDVSRRAYPGAVR